MSLVVDAPGERLEVQGFRFADAEGDEDIWRRVWQENDLDAGPARPHRGAHEGRRLRARGARRRTARPWWSIEDPLDCIVEVAPKDRRERVAALKRWVDDEGHLVAYVHLPDAVFKYRSLGKAAPVVTSDLPTGELALETSSVRWTRLEVPDEPWPLPNPLASCPSCRCPTDRGCRVAPGRSPASGSPDGRSEIAAVMSNQDAINKYRADALVASEFAAFRQRWAIGIDIPVDPETGRRSSPSSPPWTGCGRSRVRTPRTPTSVPAGGRVRGHGPEPYKLMIETEVGHISSISRIPYHFFLGQPQAIPPSRRVAKSSEAGLVRKVGRIALHRRGLGGGHAPVPAGHGRRPGTHPLAETIWRDPETQNEAVRTDAVLKQFQAGVIDLETAQEQLGYSPEQVRQMRERREAADPALPPSLTRPPRSARLHGRDRPGRIARRYHERQHQRDQRPGAGRAAPGGHDHIGVHDAGPGGRRDPEPPTADVAVLQRELAEAREAAKHRTDLRKVTDASCPRPSGCSAG